MAKAAKVPKKSAKYKMPDPLPQGLILEDTLKKKWKLGPSIGKGGFGEIYSAQEAEKSGSNYPYAVKIEPHANGPLFVEMHFYKRNIKPASVEEFKKKQKLKMLGMPLVRGSGTQEYNKEKYRFLVMDKFGDDVMKLLKDCGGKFAPEIAYKLAWQMTYVLEYIHSLGYIHADLKAANILMGITEKNKGQAYLVDYGLAEKYSTNEEFKPNPKCAHNGTIEYLSRDAHYGVATRRGDLEILAHNLLHWLGYELPWISYIKDAKKVQEHKEELWKNVDKFLTKNKITGVLQNYMNYIAKLKYNEEPSYNKIKELFATGVKSAGDSVNTPLKFGVATKSPSKRKSSELNNTPKPTKKTKIARIEEDESDAMINVPKKKVVKKATKTSKVLDKPIETLASPKKKIVKKTAKTPSPRKKTIVEETNGDTIEEQIEKENRIGNRPKRRGMRVVSYKED